MTTESEHHIAYWHGVKVDAAETIARVCREPVPTTETEVHDLVAHALESGNADQCAEVLIAASEWAHACNELKYKEGRE